MLATCLSIRSYVMYVHQTFHVVLYDGAAFASVFVVALNVFVLPVCDVDVVPILKTLKQETVNN